MDNKRMTEVIIESLATYFASQEQLTQIRHNLVAAFDEDELRTLCFDMGIDFEMLPGAHKGIKVLELISYCRRRGQLFDLLTHCAQARPNLFAVPEPADFTADIKAEEIQAYEVHGAIAHHFSADSFASQALQRFAAQPTAASSRTILQAIVYEQLEVDPAFARALQAALPDKGMPGDVITQTVTLQDKASAGNISLIGKVEGATSDEFRKH